MVHSCMMASVLNEAICKALWEPLNNKRNVKDPCMLVFL